MNDHLEESSISMEIKTEPSYECEVDKGTMENHEDSDDGPSQETSLFRCRLCSLTFANLSGLLSHRRSRQKCSYHPEKATQTKKKRFMCQYCEKCFAEKSYVDLHEQLLHSNDRPYHCRYCNITFAEVEERDSHQLTHKVDNPLSCRFCSKVFFRSRLLNHERTHTGERPLKCHYCPKTFILEGNRRLHERTHTGEKPYQCEFCPRRFAYVKSKIIHERTHTGEKPYMCHICRRPFTQSSSLKVHLRRHYDEKAFKCSLCNRGFYSSGERRYHEKMHAKGVTQKSRSSRWPRFFMHHKLVEGNSWMSCSDTQKSVYVKEEISDQQIDDL